MTHTSTMTYSFDFENGPEILDPKEMLQLPRPGPGVVNPAGDLVFVSVTQWSFTEKKNIRWLSVSALDVTVSPIHIELSLPSETVWLGDRTLGLIQKRPKDDTQCLTEYSITFDPLAPVLENSHERVIGHLPCADARDVKYSVAAKTLVFAADVYADTDLSTVAAQDKKHAECDDSALVYDDTFARHWDKWCGPKRTALFAVSLFLDEGSEDTWTLGSTYISPMKDTTHASPVYPFGGTDDFSVSKTHIVYAARDPDLPKSFHTRRNVYVTPIDGSEPPRALTSGQQGETHNPDFSHDGNFVAWLEMSEDGNDADKLVITIYDLRASIRYRLADNWDRSPDSLIWGPDDKVLYLTTHEGGRAKIFVIGLPETPSKMDASIDASPMALTHEGFAYAPQPLPDGRVVFSQTTMSSPSRVRILSPTGVSSSLLQGSETSELASFAEDGLQHKTLVPIEEVWFSGAEGRKVQGYVNLPPGFKKGQGKKWPAIMMCHGGPQAAWNDQWSTRWNPQVWAGQGYIVFTPNFTGSTGFGQAFADAVAGDYGGAPFVDMRAGWFHFLSEYPEVDTSRVGAVGGSWGGYAVNLIQGHPEWGFGFKGLVSHDGDFDAVFGSYEVDEQTITKHDWGGWPWQEKQRKLLENMSPHMFVDKWSTPQLWLHGSNDFRVPETQSLAAFHALKQRDVPARLVIFPDENHFVTRPANSLKWHYEVFRFLDQYVKKAQ